MEKPNRTLTGSPIFTHRTAMTSTVANMDEYNTMTVFEKMAIDLPWNIKTSTTTEKQIEQVQVTLFEHIS